MNDPQNSDLKTYRAIEAIGWVFVRLFCVLWLVALVLYWADAAPRIAVYLQAFQYVVFPFGLGCLMFGVASANQFAKPNRLFGWGTRVFPLVIALALLFAVVAGVLGVLNAAYVERPIDPLSQGVMTFAGIVVPLVQIYAIFHRDPSGHRYGKFKSPRAPMEDDPNRLTIDRT